MQGFCLLTGHLVGDFVLQDDFQARHKASSHLACFLHCWFYTCGVMIFTGWFLPTWAYLAVFLLHYPIDRWRLARRWMDAWGQKDFAAGDFAPWSVTAVDQTAHLVSLAVLTALAGLQGEPYPERLVWAAGVCTALLAGLLLLWGGVLRTIAEFVLEPIVVPADPGPPPAALPADAYPPPARPRLLGRACRAVVVDLPAAPGRAPRLPVPYLEGDDNDALLRRLRRRLRDLEPPMAPSECSILEASVAEQLRSGALAVVGLPDSIPVYSE